MNGQLGLFGARDAQPGPKVHHRTKCRREGCGHTAARHSRPTGPANLAVACADCQCPAILTPAEVAKPLRKAPSTGERLWLEGYEAGIREASPQPFLVTARKCGGIFAPLLATYAPDVHGVADQAAWLRDKARTFRLATAERPEFWGGWQPYKFGQWLAQGQTVSAKPRASALQPMPAGGLKIRQIRLKP